MAKMKDTNVTKSQVVKDFEQALDLLNQAKALVKKYHKKVPDTNFKHMFKVGQKRQAYNAEGVKYAQNYDEYCSKKVPSEAIVEMHERWKGHDELGNALDAFWQETRKSQYAEGSDLYVKIADYERAASSEGKHGDTTAARIAKKLREARAKPGPAKKSAAEPSALVNQHD
jgi:hypothetical protein